MSAARSALVLAVLLAACGRYRFDERAPDDAGDGDSRIVPVVDSSADSSIDASPNSARGVAAGRSHSCAILDGVLSCWGDNTMGQLGVGDFLPRTSPALVDPVSTWTAVTNGSLHTCAIKADGGLWCWGDNSQGQAGLGVAIAATIPVKLNLPLAALTVASKFESTCAVLVDHELWCWGVNAEGQLGQNSTASPITQPVRVGIESAWTFVATGQGHVLAVSAGIATGTGRNTMSELGLGQGGNVQYRTMQPISQGPWRSTSAGQQTSLGVRTDGSLWSWGGATGPLGVSTAVQRDVPTLVDSAQQWITAVVDTFHGCGVVVPGAMRCWGRNAEGQLGRGDMTSTLTPLESGSDTTWESVAVARFHTCAQRRDGSVWCTGDNGSGELGVGDVSRRLSWTQVALP